MTTILCEECKKPLGSNGDCPKCRKWNEFYDEAEFSEDGDEDDELFGEPGVEWG